MVSGVPSLDFTIGVLMIAGPWVFGALLGYFLAPRRFGLVMAIGVGLVLTALGLLGFFLTAPTSPADCRECSEYFGRWIDYSLVREWPIYTALAWSVAAAFGAMRAERTPRDRSTSTSGPSSMQP